MTVDYDLVIVGATPEALQAAAIALRYQARIALVRSPHAYSWQQEFLSGQILTHTNLPPHQVSAFLFEMSRHEQAKLVDLGVAGVDIIAAEGEFCRLPRLAFLAGNRRLQSPSYLIATGAHPTIPHYEGLQQVNYLTPKDLYSLPSFDELPQNLAIIAHHSLAIQLAQLLNSLGKNITLITKDQQLLPAEEPEISHLFQAILEAEGIKVLSNSPVTQIKQIEDTKWIQAGDQALEVQEIILTPIAYANLHNLNLQGVGIKVDKSGIIINNKFQTSHKSIYACGGVTGSWENLNIAQYQAELAVKNALTYLNYQPNYQVIPSLTLTSPPIARVGLTERQAQAIYGDQVEVVTTDYRDLELAQIKNQTRGFSKVVVTKKGKILGAHILGAEAGEIIGSIAIAMENKLNLARFAHHFPNFSYGQMLTEIAQQWQNYRYQKHPPLPYLKQFLDWRRRWS